MGVDLVLLILIVAVMRSWSAMKERVTSELSTMSGLLVMITSKRVAEVGVIRVGSNPHATTWDFSVIAEWPKTTNMLPRRPSINPDSRRTRPVNQECVPGGSMSQA